MWKMIIYYPGYTLHWIGSRGNLQDTHMAKTKLFLQISSRYPGCLVFEGVILAVLLGIYCGIFGKAMISKQ